MPKLWLIVPIPFASWGEKQQTDERCQRSREELRVRPCLLLFLSLCFECTEGCEVRKLNWDAWGMQREERTKPCKGKSLGSRLFLHGKWHAASGWSGNDVSMQCTTTLVAFVKQTKHAWCLLHGWGTAWRRRPACRLREKKKRGSRLLLGFLLLGQGWWPVTWGLAWWKRACSLGQNLSLYKLTWIGSASGLNLG